MLFPPVVTPTLNVGSTLELIFGDQYYCRIDSIRVTNTTNLPLSLNFQIVYEDENENPVYQDSGLNESFQPFETRDLYDIPKGGWQYTASGWTIWGRTESSDTFFNSIVSYRRFEDYIPTVGTTAWMRWDRTRKLYGPHKGIETCKITKEMYNKVYKLAA